MRRSEINDAVRYAERWLRDLGVHLPPFASLTPDELSARRHELSGILVPRLGWDVTDFGSGRFERTGLTLITLRNGLAGDGDSAPAPRPYAEKLLVVRDGQRTPLHTHRVKTEDIVHRGGVGDLVIELRTGDPDEGPRDGSITVWTDGTPTTLPSGGHLVLRPGESVTLRPGDYHAFWADGGTVLAGEVSSVNDDATDNVFVDASPRFSAVVEDAPPYRLLVSDYPGLEVPAAEVEEPS